MPRITVQPIHSEGEPRRWTLSERIVAENLDSDHYIAQLMQRLLWATVDAEAAEVQSAAHDDDGEPRPEPDSIGRRALGAPSTRVGV